MTIRLLHIIPTLDRGGAEKQLALLATQLPADEFDVHVCALARGGPLLARLENHDIPVTVLSKRAKIDPVAWWRLERHIRRLAPDLVQTWLFAGNSYGRTAAMAAGPARLIASERCVDRWKVWHELAIDRFLVRRTSRVIVNSRGVRDFYIRHGLPEEKFAVIPNGIVVPSESGSESRELLREQLNIPPEAHLIGAVGRLWPQKRVKDLLWAAHLLYECRGDAHLLIVGDGPERDRLERYSRLYEVERYVHFLGHRDDVPRLLPQLDCLWLASGYEGQSNAVMEAMAAGVPVVATDIPGNRDLIAHQQTGFLVPVGDRARFARWANVLFEDPQAAATMAQAARKRMRDRFTIERMVERHADVYREVVGG